MISVSRFIMDKNNRNHENDDDENVYGMKKNTYLEKYGAKHFPYRGRRKYTPLIIQSVDGGMFISNDVFGLTIRQFERMYKYCLQRRKTHEQWIVNLRYPEKSSNEYLEYLQNYDIVFNSINKHTQISSGSLAEGLDLPGSDIDIMIVLNQAVVIRNVRDTKYVKQTEQHYKHPHDPKQQTIFVMETDNDHPGFTRLRLIAAGETIPITSENFESTTKGLYLSVNGFLNSMKKMQLHHHLIPHGPCLTFSDQSRDLAFCLRSKYIPYNATPWAMRNRRQWPPNFVIDKIKQYGCLLVPIGPRNKSDSNILWRLSFSMAEKQLVHSFNFTQLLCYGLLKLTLKCT
ncbi:unnamed protein product [Mytilus coruscus]|uniref:Polymerase nucleotidyl transferase domain-containing protein n=1 Tax=Mytilus coruscus TaxID=42192 RepID=A0A6J8CRI4_MYTCO|nr:unnamed protein product [Mytilus coruscus]